MTNYEAYISEVTSLLMGLFLFLFSFRILDLGERFEAWLKTYGKLFKVCSIVSILCSCYSIYYKYSNSHHQWRAEDKINYINHCILKANSPTAEYSDVIRECCECSWTRITNKMTCDEWLIITEKQKKDEIEKTILPIIQNCIDEAKQKIDSIKQKKSSR